MVDSSKFKEMSPMELDRWMTENKEFCLIDILPNDHFCKIHLPDSKNACVFEINFIDQIKDIIQDKDTQIVLYGSSDRSMDALKAAEKLEMEGYKNLIVLKGGLKDWQSHGFILEGDAINEHSDPQTLLKLEDGSYRVNTDQSTIHWTGRNSFSTHFGNINISEGELELRGVKAQQSFMTTITKTPENGLAAEAHFDLDRTRWGIIYGSTRFFEHLGMHQVFDLISIQVRIVAF